MKLINNLYDYRELLKTNVKKEIRGKYKGSFLGVLWSFINPLLQVLVYSIVFPVLMGTSTNNYVLFLVVGIIPWTFFVTVINQGMTTIKSNAGIIKKVYFPREILPISVVVSGIVNFLISCIIIVLFAFIYNVGIGWQIIFLPLVVLVQAIFSLGLVFALSAINIYIKDTEYIIQFVLNMVFYGTPILYERAKFEQNQMIMLLFKLNPMATIIDAYRDIFMVHKVPDLQMLGILGVISCVLLVIGYKVFKLLEKGFAEEI